MLMKHLKSQNLLKFKVLNTLEVCNFCEFLMFLRSTELALK